MSSEGDPSQTNPDPQVVGEIQRDPVTQYARDVEEHRTNPRMPRVRTRFSIPLASRRTLYFLVGSIIALLMNAFGIFLFVVTSDRVSPESIWYLWVDGIVTGIVIVYALGLMRRLHQALGGGGV
ncbi:MAG TPA: hypothetical protein VMV18_06880 [bacterium]|nr:hypothetical protein [bacterium]